MPHDKKVRRWPRFVAYLPIECTPCSPGQGDRRRLAGKTLNVAVGGIALVLPETLPLGISVFVSLCEEEPIRGHIVWVDRRMRTLLGTTVPHGLAFDQPVDPDLVHRWVSQAKKRVHIRAAVQFDVEVTQIGSTARATCLNLSEGGMFIATDRPAELGIDVMLRFTLPSLSDAFSVRARVAWTHTAESEPDAIVGMGVQFLEINPLEAAVIGAFVDRLATEAFAPLSSSSLPRSS